MKDFLNSRLAMALTFASLAIAAWIITAINARAPLDWAPSALTTIGGLVTLLGRGILQKEQQ